MNVISGGSYYNVQCGEADKLKYHDIGFNSSVPHPDTYYRFEYCPFCGKEIERVY